MAFVNLILTARTLKRQKKALIEEKLEAIKADEEQNHRKKFQFRHIGVDLKEAVKRFCKRIVSRGEGSCGYRTCYKLGHEGSCENYVLKSVLGFVAGVILTYFLYIVLIFQLNVELTSATLICSALGCVLTIGLAFSTRVRCIVLLALPQFFSKRGRQALLAYAFVLALAGPTRNIVNNMGILSESLACGQEQLKQAVKQIIDVVKKPFLAIKEAIKKVVKTVKEVVKKIKEILMKIKRIVMSIVRVIKSAFEFLGKIINICNKELGTPFERCTRVFDNAIADCNASLGPLFNWLCSLSYIVKAVCYIVKIFDYICMMVDFLSNSVVGVIIRKMKTFVRHIKTMFYVKIRFSHSFKYKTVSSKSVTQIAKEIVAEIKDRSRDIVAFFNFMTLASLLFFVYLIFEVAYYRFKYLTSERFDNVYITKYFRDIDQRRAKSNKETVLPLTRMEKTMYVSMRSESLSKTERRNLFKNTIKLMTVCVNLGTHMAADYSLYWMLSLISRHARYQSKVEAPNLPMAHVSGEGFLAMLLRAIVNAFQPIGLNLEIDTVPCLPIPIPPDLDRYIQIAITVGICWILTVLEPYGLRFRNYIMGYYHPLRAKQRTIWLYNHILRSRTTFLLLARRKLRRKFGTKSRENEISSKEWLRSQLRCVIFRICLGDDLQLTCLLCGQVFREKDKSNFVRCSTPQCPGLFCLECFEDLKNICPVCLSPAEYGDLDEFREEKDSSDDEPPPDKPRKKPQKCPKWLLCGTSKDDEEAPLCPKKDIGETSDEKLNKTDKEFLEEYEEKKEQVSGDESDSSTDYSYSYQYEVQKELLQLETIAWRDIEMQAMADEVTMEVFNEKQEFLSMDLDDQIRVPEGHTALISIDVTTSQEEAATDSALVDLQIIAEDNEDSECQCSSYSKRAEVTGVPRDYMYKKVYCTCSELEEPGSTISPRIKSECNFCKCSDVEDRSAVLAVTETEQELVEIVPMLDLSCLEQKCSCDNPVLSSRFSYVSYQEVCESYSGKSLESSSLLSSLENSPSEMQKTTKNVRTRDSTPDSPNSMDSYEFNKILRGKVRRCYQRSRIPCESRQSQQNEERSSIANMFKKLLPKRNKEKSYLPLHNRDLKELPQDPLQNYNKRDWNPLAEDIDDSPAYPLDSSSGSGEDQALLGENRIRGGQCTSLMNNNRLGRQRPAKRIGSSDAKSELIFRARPKLKDFSTLTLPSKPKSVNSKEFISQVLFNIEEMKSNNSMPADGENRLI
ncbi:DC-STAMP domain-containing protein 2-like [Euwallacea fornicatus]|uniref:DC-STAMP domain-containing protein 2-like n=1 Tax=Euwallacea fornicatus TaxID=995702 RepID=UPI00338DBA5C